MENWNLLYREKLIYFFYHFHKDNVSNQIENSRLYRNSFVTLEACPFFSNPTQNSSFYSSPSPNSNPNPKPKPNPKPNFNHGFLPSMTRTKLQTPNPSSHGLTSITHSQPTSRPHPITKPREFMGLARPNFRSGQAEAFQALKLPI